MAEKMIAYCGLVCTECPAYVGTQTGDEELLEKTAERWSTPEHKIRPDDILCDGCRAVGKRLTGFCSCCKVRSCGMEKGLENCACCDEYPCKTLEELWGFIKAREEAKAVLDEIRAKEQGRR